MSGDVPAIRPVRPGDGPHVRGNRIWNFDFINEFGQ